MAEWTVGDFDAAHKPARATARVGFRQDLWDRHAQLEAKLVATIQADSRENRDPEAPAVLDEVEAVEAEIRASEHEFVFASIGRKAWLALVAEHPPTPDQQAEGSDHNGDTFPAAAVAASAVEPTMSVETAQAMMAKLNVSQWAKLWNACLAANAGGGDSPKSEVATALRRLLEPSSTTASPEESLAASS